MRIVKRFLLLSFSCLCLIILSLIFLVQSPWVKQQISNILQLKAKQMGAHLSVGKIEGKLPFSWNFDTVRLMLPDQDCVNIENLQLHLDVFSLFKGKVEVLDIYADSAQLSYDSSHHTAGVLSHDILDIPSFSIRYFCIDHFTVMDSETKIKNSYQLTGSGTWVPNQKLSLSAHLYSNEVQGVFFVEADLPLNHFFSKIQLQTNTSAPLFPFHPPTYGMQGEIEAEIQGPWSAAYALIFHPFQKIDTQALTGKCRAKITKMSHPRIPLQLFPVKAQTNFSWESNQTLNVISSNIESAWMDIETKGSLDCVTYSPSFETSCLIHKLSFLHPSLQGEAKAFLKIDDSYLTSKLLSSELKIQDVFFTDTHFGLSLQKKDSKWEGTFQGKSINPLLGFEAFSFINFDHKILSFSHSSVKCPSAWFSMDMDFDMSDYQLLDGGASFQIADLAIFSALVEKELGGQVGGSFHAEQKKWEGLVIAKQLKWDTFIADRLELDASYFYDLITPQGTLKISCGPSYAYQLYLNELTSNILWNINTLSYDLTANGEWKEDFLLVSKGSITYDQLGIQYVLNELQGTIFNKNFLLKNPCQMRVEKDFFELNAFNLLVDQGSLVLSSFITPTKAQIDAKASHFPLDFLTLLSPRYSLQGLSSLDMHLEAFPHTLEGQISGLLEYADIYPAGSLIPIQTKGNIQAHFSKDILQIHSHFVATDHQFCELSATVPFAFQLNPIAFNVKKDEPLTGQCTIEGHLEQLFDFINLGSQRIGGFLSTHLLLSGTLEEPVLNGPICLQEGFYDNYLVGIVARNTHIQAVAAAHQINFQEISMTDGENGTCHMTGMIHLNAEFPFTMQGAVDHFRLLRLDWLTGTASGPFIIEGTTEKALVKGDLKLNQADITIPEQLPFELPSLEVTLINQPKSHHTTLSYEKPFPICYDLYLGAENNLFLSGRGVDAELEGNLHLSGQNLAIILSGKLETKSGFFSCAGKRFKITNGELLFSENLHFLNITSHVELPDLVVTGHLRGPLKSPQLIFESSPSLPTSSILARILFNKDISELSAPQALQLANTIVTLSGNSGPNVLESIRKGLGIDALSFTSSEDTSQVFVQIGKYLTQGVMITLIQGTESSNVKVEVALKAGFALEAETQENNQGKFSLKWNAIY